MTTEQLVQEHEEGEQFIFPDLDRILALAVHHPQALVSSLDTARWILKEDVIVALIHKLEDHLIKIKTLGNDFWLPPSISSTLFSRPCVKVKGLIPYS